LKIHIDAGGTVMPHIVYSQAVTVSQFFCDIFVRLSVVKNCKGSYLYLCN